MKTLEIRYTPEATECRALLADAEGVPLACYRGRTPSRVLSRLILESPELLDLEVSLSIEEPTDAPPPLATAPPSPALGHSGRAAAYLMLLGFPTASALTFAGFAAQSWSLIAAALIAQLIAAGAATCAAAAPESFS